MQVFAQVPLEMVRVVEGIVVLFLAIPELMRLFSFLGVKRKYCVGAGGSE
jgi:hypothetical protein